MTVQLIFYWLALFESTSYFVKMVTSSVYDIRWFGLMMMLCLLSFANAIVILTKPASDEGEPVIDQKFDMVYLDSLLSSYMLGLGEFETDNYGDNNFNNLLWLYFMLATFLSQIVFVNTLIAILGSTYARIMDNKVTHALMERAKIYHDFMHLIKPMKRLCHAKFIYVVKPVQAQDNENENGFESVRAMIEKVQLI